MNFFGLQPSTAWVLSLFQFYKERSREAQKGFQEKLRFTNLELQKSAKMSDQAAVQYRISENSFIFKTLQTALDLSI